MPFSSLGFSPALLPAFSRAVAEKGYQQPTAIQTQAIPAILQGRDVLGSAQTGPYGIFASCFIPAPKARLAAGAYGHLEQDLATLRPYLKEAIRLRRKGVNILLHGQPGTGKTAFVRMLAASLKARLFEISTADSGGEPIQGEIRFRSYRLSQAILAAQLGLSGRE